MHQSLANGKWQQMSLMQQLGNIGSEVERALRAKKKNDNEAMQSAFYRALELIDLTLSDRRWSKRYKEITRTREVVCDYFTDGGLYKIKDESLSKYFLQFGIAAQLEK